MAQLQKSAISKAQGPPCPVEPPIWERLQNSALMFRDKLAVASLHQPASLYGISKDTSKKAYLRWSYSELLEAVNILSSSISSQLAGQTVPIVTVLDNGVEHIIASWVAYRLGCPFVPLSLKALANTEELQYMLQMVGDAVVIVQDSKTSEKLDNMGRSFILNLTLSETSPDSSWTSLTSIFAAESTKLEHDRANTVGAYRMADVVTILFTSGTTSKPKGVPHNSTTLNAFCQNLSFGGRSHEHVFCSCLPNNHAMGYFFTLHFMMNGGAVVYPSPSFDGPSIIKGINAERATHVGLVPTMLYTLCEALTEEDNPSACSRPTTLKDVCLAGSAISSAMVRQVRFELGSKAVSIGFGMTEGSPIWSEPVVDPERLFEGPHTIAGSVVPGAQVKLCEPGTREPVPQGTPGEIHQAGPGLVGRYLNGQGQEQFYEDEYGTRWFITGDQAIMHPDCRFSITGRYKDIIIRGGKNISPAAIELVLNKYMGITVSSIGVTG
jgi:acyl-CoA synthetase (AMP-forming)/AMP-acid ligase II